MDNNMNLMETTPEKKLNPWRSIWLLPRKTMRTILDGNHGPVVLLGALGGIADSFVRMAGKNDHIYESLFGILSTALFGGIIGGIIGIYIMSGLLKLTGSWIGGKGNYDEILTAVAWANVPAIWSLIVWFLGGAVFGASFFKGISLVLEVSPTLNILAWIFNIILIVVGIWTIFVTVKCVAEAQEFSAWKAVLNYILSYMFFVVPVVLIVMITR